MNLFVIIHPFCVSNIWIDEIESGTTSGKPSNGGAETGGGVVVLSGTRVGIAVGETVGTGLNIDTLAVQAKDAKTNVNTSNLILMGLLVTESTKDPTQKFLSEPFDNCCLALPHSNAESRQPIFDISAHTHLMDKGCH